MPAAHDLTVALLSIGHRRGDDGRVATVRTVFDLSPAEARVLGSLMEKEVTTPDGYPLTVNALMSACNQTTNRYPIVRYGEVDVVDALTILRERHYTRIVYSQSNRAPKHRQVASEVLKLEPDAHAALCVLLLRGAQTLGEIKGRTERMHAFSDLAATELTLDALAARDEPLVVRLPRRPGQKDARYVHLMSGPVEVDSFDDADPSGTALPSTPRADRINDLEQRVAELEHEVADLRSLVERLRPLIDD